MDDTIEQNATSPRALAMRTLPDEILAVALRNDRKRFFAPSGHNTFAGIRYEYVMIDSGCNSLLMPFPVNINDLRQFSGDEFFWEVNWSRGVGAIMSPTLLIYNPETNQDVGDLILAGRFVAKLKSLRFHLGKESAQTLLGLGFLHDTEKAKIEGFLQDLGDKNCSERRYVLLGQAVLSQVFSLQAGKLLLLASRGYFPRREDFRAAWRVIRDFECNGLLPNEFHDLEDVDHDGDIIAAWSDEFDDENWDQGAFRVG